MQRLLACGLLIAAASLCANALAQTAAPTYIVHDTFANGDGGWTSIGGSGTITVVHDTDHVKDNKGALQFDYPVEKGKLGFLFRPVEVGSLAKAKALRLWVRDTATAPVGVVLQEKDGGRYVSMVTVPKDKWQLIELAPSDFVLSEDANDPKDPDNKLDLDQVENVGIADIAQLVVQTDNADLATLFGVHSGPRTLLLGDFSVSDQPLPAATAPADGTVVLESFAHPQLNWITAGEVTIARSTGKPLDGPGLQADYHIAPGKVIGLIRKVRTGSLAGATGLKLTVAAAKEMKLLVQVEEKDGGKYNKVVTVAGDKGIQYLNVAFSELTAAQDSHDANDKLDTELINQVVLLDASGLLDMTEGDNTLWVGTITARK